MDEWMSEQVIVKADLRITYSNKKVNAFTSFLLKAFLVFVPSAEFLSWSNPNKSGSNFKIKLYIGLSQVGYRQVIFIFPFFILNHYCLWLSSI